METVEGFGTESILGCLLTKHRSNFGTMTLPELIPFPDPALLFLLRTDEGLDIGE